MVSSWFRSNEATPPLKDIIKVLHPKGSSQHTSRPLDDRSRFSQLLLEHGETQLQDWAVVAYSSPCFEAETSENASPDKSDKIHWAQAPPPASHRKATPKTKKKNLPPVKTELSPSEIDKDSYPSAHMTKIEGQLRLCSRSLVFEPYETSRGIVRCPFAKMDGPPREFPADPGFAAMCVEFRSLRHFVIKSNNVVGPFENVTVRIKFRFTFLHSSPKSFVDLTKELFAMAKDRPSAQGSPPELDALLQPMLDRPFDVGNLIDIREQILTSNLRCSIQTPLQSKPGVLVMTAERVYFQGSAGIERTVAAPRAVYWWQRDVVATARRYNGLRDSAVEIYWKDSTSTLFAFERRHDREQVLRYLQKQVPCFTDRDFVVQVFEEWQKSTLSNFDYLLALNAAAGRSFHDLSRYPVFPWVIADYESAKLDLTKEETFRDLTKPVGALNQERLDYFRTRMSSMQDMEEHSFLYGTHYSAPGYVLYFLIRSMPEHMLCLQNGKFDAPDRMFHTISQTYSCVLKNHADVKELIPEFYNSGKDFDFLINARGLQLGATQNGERVDDVALPPWARSGRDFIKKNRKALESDICTRMLPRWIDLIFGCKSRGDAAKEADNVFHRITYLGPRDLADMQTPEERFQAELQATEFGIVPDMLFHGPHPLKHETVNHDFISADIGRASSKEDPGSGGREAWELLDPPPTHNAGDSLMRGLAEPSPELQDTVDEKPSLDAPSSNLGWGAADTADASFAHSPPRANLALRGTGHSTLPDQPPEDMRGPVSSNQASSPKSPEPSSPVQPVADASPTASDWDMKIIERRRIHGDAVSGCVLQLDSAESKPMLVSTSLDGGLMAHTLLDLLGTEDSDRRGLSSTFTRFSYSTILNRGQSNVSASESSKLTEFRSHSSRDPLASLVLASDGSNGCVAFAGGHDDVVLAYGINSACAVASVYSHRDAVTGLDLIARTGVDGESSLWLENSTHIMISGSWDATVKVWSASVSNGETVSISREPLAELFDADSSIVCVSAQSIPNNGGIVIGAGCADGSFCVWTVHGDGVQVVLHKETSRKGSGPCSVVKWMYQGGTLHLFAAFATGKVASYTLIDGALQRQSAVSVGVAVSALVYSEGILLVGCADGSLRLIPVRHGACFDSKPTLWKGVNSKSSPGISSISVAYMKSPIDGMIKCICCTGGEDGTVALFELKKAT